MPGRGSENPIHRFDHECDVFRQLFRLGFVDNSFYETLIAIEGNRNAALERVLFLKTTLPRVMFSLFFCRRQFICGAHTSEDAYRCCFLYATPECLDKLIGFAVGDFKRTPASLSVSDTQQYMCSATGFRIQTIWLGITPSAPEKGS